jgi:hypothetical protein
MRHALSVFDELIPLDRLMEIRKEVIATGFSEEKGPDGCIYTGICKNRYPEIFEAIAKALAHPIAVGLSCFRLNMNGEVPHCWVHSDEGCGQYAGVLYLNPPEQCVGGTAFWQHRGMNIDEMPSEADLKAGRWDPKWYAEMMNAEWKKKDAWDQVGFSGMKFGRFITYPTARFHSRFPFEAFGSGPQDGRLIMAVFFDILEKPMAAVKPDEPSPAAPPV